MQSPKAKTVIFAILLFLLNNSICFAEIRAILHSTNIQAKSIADNILASRHAFSANGFITEGKDSNKKENNSAYNSAKPYKITAEFDDIRLDNCNFVILNEQTVSRLMHLDGQNNAIIAGWTLNCDLPSSLKSGIYTAKIDIILDNQESASILADNIQYDRSISFLTPKQTLLIIFLIVLFFSLRLPPSFQKIIIFLSASSLCLACITKNIYPFYGFLFWLFIAVIFYCLRPKSAIHRIAFNNLNFKHKFAIAIFLIASINIYMIPISMSPFHTSPLKYNGNWFNINEQYAALAQQILKGKLYIDYGDLYKRLADMDNPYDPSQRAKDNIEFPLDHSYYKEKFYMYFGVVPVFLLFIPYQLMMGEPLQSYYATKIFVILSIIGLFSLFYLLTQKLFARVTLGMYLALSASFSMIATWCYVDTPALYCTASSSAVCFSIWSIYFFVRYFLLSMSQKRKIINMFIGSLLGALVFGCRPPIGLANIVFLPVLFHFILKNGGWRLKDVVLVASPYFVVLSLLMLYNYLRFDNPFEFGLSYLLTFEDLHSYKLYIQSKFDINVLLSKLHFYFFNINQFHPSFPFVNFNGIFINFPILFTLFLVLNKNVFKYFTKFNICFFVFFLFFVPLIIASFNSIVINDIIERYRMDIYFSIVISCYFALCAYCMTVRNPQKTSFFVSVASFLTILYNILLMFVPQQGNFTYFFPEINQRFYHIVSFGLGN